MRLRLVRSAGGANQGQTHPAKVTVQADLLTCFMCSFRSVSHSRSQHVQAL